MNFWTREVTVGGPAASDWIQLSTAIVFGLAFSKGITLGLVPAMLALPYRIRERRRAAHPYRAPLPQQQRVPAAARRGPVPDATPAE
jgi:hypothetical protein